jgi:hypothetical protein
LVERRHFGFLLLFLVRHLGLGGIGHSSQHRERQALARQEDQADADADRRLDGLQPEPVGDRLSRRDAVLAQRQRDRCLEEADVAGPEREQRRHVHQQQHEPGRRERRVDVEGPHRRVDREELAQPTEALEERCDRRRPRRVQDAEPVLDHGHDAPDRPQLLEHRLVVPPGAGDGERQQPEPDHADDDQTRDRPVRDLRGQEHVKDQADGRDQVEEPVREDRSDERGPDPAHATMETQLPREDGDSRELADPSREHRVREQPHRERRENCRVARVRRWDRLLDDRVPRERANEHRDEVERDRDDDPFPFDRVEGVPDRAPVGPAPPEERSNADRGRDDRHDPHRSRAGHAVPHVSSS